MSLQNRYLNPMFGCGHEATGFTGLVTTGPIGDSNNVYIYYSCFPLLAVVGVPVRGRQEVYPEVPEV